MPKAIDKGEKPCYTVIRGGKSYRTACAAACIERRKRKGGAQEVRSMSETRIAEQQGTVQKGRKKMKRHLFGSILLVALVLCIAIPTYANTVFKDFIPEVGLINRVVYEDDNVRIIEHRDISPTRNTRASSSMIVRVYDANNNPLQGKLVEKVSSVDSQCGSAKTNSSGTVIFSLRNDYTYGFNIKTGSTQTTPGFYTPSEYGYSSQVQSYTVQIDTSKTYPKYNDPVLRSISSHYGYRLYGGLKIHKGLDLAADKGTEIKSITSGKYVQHGNDTYYGNYVVLDHGNYRVRYQHMRDGYAGTTSTSTTIPANTTIGYVGNTGKDVSGYHLHISVYEKQGSSDNYTEIDPLFILNHNDR